MRTINLKVDNAFYDAIEFLKAKFKKRPDKRAKLYVWKQRFGEQTLSEKKICDVMEQAGYQKSVEVRWRKKVNSTQKRRLVKK
jgi:hypothetical protein